MHTMYVDLYTGIPVPACINSARAKTHRTSTAGRAIYDVWRPTRYFVYGAETLSDTTATITVSTGVNAGSITAGICHINSNQNPLWTQKPSIPLYLHPILGSDYYRTFPRNDCKYRQYYIWPYHNNQNPLWARTLCYSPMFTHPIRP